MWFTQTLRRRSYNKINKRIDDLRISLEKKIQSEIRATNLPIEMQVEEYLSRRIPNREEAVNIGGRVGVLEGNVFGLTVEVMKLKEENRILKTKKKK